MQYFTWQEKINSEILRQDWLQPVELSVLEGCFWLEKENVHSSRMTKYRMQKTKSTPPPPPSPSPQLTGILQEN